MFKSLQLYKENNCLTKHSVLWWKITPTQKANQEELLEALVLAQFEIITHIVSYYLIYICFSEVGF